MEYLKHPNIKFNSIIELILLLILFIHGYSTPLDTIYKQNCHDGFSIQINGKYECIDTTFFYYPTLTEKWGDEYMVVVDKFYNMENSINLQILQELKWYNEEIEEDRLRIVILITKNYPNIDSIVLYSFIKLNNEYTRLLKKEMTFFYPYFYIFENIAEAAIVNYRQTEFIIHKKKMQNLIKQLNILTNFETFNRYTSAFRPAFVIEHICNGRYTSLIATEPSKWFKVPYDSEFKDIFSPRKNGLKVMKWLNKY